MFELTFQAIKKSMFFLYIYTHIYFGGKGGVGSVKAQTHEKNSTCVLKCFFSHMSVHDVNDKWCIVNGTPIHITNLRVWTVDWNWSFTISFNIYMAILVPLIPKTHFNVVPYWGLRNFILLQMTSYRLLKVISWLKIHILKTLNS